MTTQPTTDTELLEAAPEDLASIRLHEAAEALEQGISDYHTRVDQALLSHYGCQRNVLKAIKAGEVKRTSCDGLWQTWINENVVAEMRVTTITAPPHP